jgi:hypothetical protein
MTTTKLIYVLAVIVPGGFFILAALVLARSIWMKRQCETTAVISSARMGLTLRTAPAPGL